MRTLPSKQGVEVSQERIELLSAAHGIKIGKRHRGPLQVRAGHLDGLVASSQPHAIVEDKRHGAVRGMLTDPARVLGVRNTVVEGG